MSTFATALRNRLTALVCLNILFVFFGIWLTPSALSVNFDGAKGFYALVLLLLLYLFAALRGIKPTERAHETILPGALFFGSIIGFVFAAEILLEYRWLPDSALNTRMGYFEFGTAFFLYLCAGFWSAFKTRRFLSALLTPLWSAAFASLIWLCVVLLVFYMFHGTERQTAVLQAEGDFEDFKQSGMTDFNAFILQDFWGAGFFHLLLGPVIAGILGSLGAGLSLLLSFFSKRR
ncbi:MAG: hypothetical protein WCR52_00360 [Bacteroidota bacterium]